MGSSSPYEMGPQSPCKDPSYCMCVKTTDNGTAVQSAKASLAKQEVSHKSAESMQGQELQTKRYLVQPPADCNDCAAHNCSREACNKCSNCEFGDRTVMGRQAKGCYDRDFGESRHERITSKEGRKYLYAGMDGREAEAQEQSLLVIPHYNLWDPGDQRMNGEAGGQPEDPSHILRWPYNSRREPLSREAWINDYKQAAPRIQSTIDSMVAKVKE